MIKLIGTADTPFTVNIDSQMSQERNILFAKYKQAGKIIGDFIFLTDRSIEIKFIDNESAQAFAQEADALYKKYDETLSIDMVV